MTPRTRKPARNRGSIDKLPSGAYRVRVHAGVDPLTGRRHTLTEVVPAGPKAEKLAKDVRDRMLREVAERRNVRTNATVDQLLERYMAQFDGSPNTVRLYRSHIRLHISPLLGRFKLSHIDAETLDSFYAELRRCRTHCTSRREIDHRTSKDHECDERCGPHVCNPLSPNSVRHNHFVLSGAFKKAVRWRWMAVNPATQAEPPPAPSANPQPPTAAEAARIVEEAWKDPDWGAFVWVAITTGARRGELCAIRWGAVNLDEGREAVWLRRAIRKRGSEWEEADLKTHQQRRIALDVETAEVLRDLRQRSVARAEAIGAELADRAFVFSPAPDGAEYPIPDSVSQRYDRLTTRLKIATSLHKLRHYSATELILAGVDIRTVAGRLGHGSGGVTTLRTYTAWVAEADQRAAAALISRISTRPR